jgi:hypothetical protein
MPSLWHDHTAGLATPGNRFFRPMKQARNKPARSSLRYPAPRPGRSSRQQGKDMSKSIKELTVEELDMVTGSDLSDMSTALQLQMQMEMQKKSQFEQIFSNILKTTSDTSSEIVKNLKS